MRGVLIAEGKADRALTNVLERLCHKYGYSEIAVEWIWDHLALYGGGKDLVSKLKTLELFENNFGINFEIVFVHRDADQVGLDSRLAEIGRAVEALSLRTVGYVSVVPVQETEAWLLADADAIRRTVGCSKSVTLDIPSSDRIESLKDPKSKLRDVLTQARRAQRRTQSNKDIDDRSFGRYRRELLETLDINGPVSSLPAWQRLEADIKTRFEVARAQLDEK